MYHFISGYTAKVAGTERGVKEPSPTFSACFGAPFMAQHPSVYAHLLGKKIEEHKVRVWLVNTGWTGGPYGVGSRMKLAYTRAMINAALNGELDNVEYVTEPVFGLAIPTSCPNVPAEVLNPRNTWADKAAYDAQIRKLAGMFVNNFKQYEDQSSPGVRCGAEPERINNLGIVSRNRWRRDAPASLRYLFLDTRWRHKLSHGGTGLAFQVRGLRVYGAHLCDTIPRTCHGPSWARLFRTRPAELQ